MSDMTPEGLGEFIRLVDQKFGGNLQHPELSGYYPIALDFKTRIDQDLDPFSEAYFDQQVALYEEISGHTLDQWGGELHRVDVASLQAAPNPLGLTDPSRVAELVRSLVAMLSICDLSAAAKVLDMGAGHGLSSEVFAFCGCQVHAVDIDPQLGQLSLHRSAARSLGIARSTLNFDDLSSLPDHTYDAAFFFQSFHHCLRPWELIASLKTKIVDGGVIAFTGEPIQDTWWRHWGIRLDEESLYVARSYGWFESGWSSDFLKQCFERNGMTLQLFSGGHGGGEIGIATAGPSERFTSRAHLLGHRLARPGVRYFSQIGQPALLAGVPALRAQTGHSDGCLIFGPYVTLVPGSYSISFLLQRDDGDGADSAAVFDVCADSGVRKVYEESFSSTQWVRRVVKIEQRAARLEARVFLRGPAGWTCSEPEIERL